MNPTALMALLANDDSNDDEDDDQQNDDDANGEQAGATSTTSQTRNELHTGTPQSQRETLTLSTELAQQRLIFWNLHSPMAASLYSMWDDYHLPLNSDTSSTWPLWVTVSHKRARSNRPDRQGSTPFHCVYINLQCRTQHVSLSVATSYQGYLILVAVPRKFTGFEGLESKSASSILSTLKAWLVKTQALGRVHQVQLLCTDAATIFLSDEFIGASM
jgi:hypothetical protein